MELGKDLERVWKGEVAGYTAVEGRKEAEGGSGCDIDCGLARQGIKEFDGL